jgi:hypothetical protein
MLPCLSLFFVFFFSFFLHATKTTFLFRTEESHERDEQQLHKRPMEKEREKKALSSHGTRARHVCCRQKGKASTGKGGGLFTQTGLLDLDPTLFTHEYVHILRGPVAS